MGSIATRPLPGGPLSIDLLNTTWSPPTGPVDWLDDDAAVRFFAQSHGHLAVDAREARDALVHARGLVRRLFVGAGTPPDDELVEDVERVMSRAAVHVDTSHHSPQIRITSDEQDWALAVEAVVDAIGLLGDRPDRIRSCEHDDCTLWFYDVSKAGRRRWCSMERCGNRAKARRHYARVSERGE